MCTVTWRRTNDGYSLFCNRDERKTRRPALGPRLSELRGVRYIAPVDGDHGGSWIGVNEFGFTLCLLNRYGEVFEEFHREYVSRGLLLCDLLDSRGSDVIEKRIRESALRQFQPFTLMVLAVGGEARLFHWTGRDSWWEKKVESQVLLTSTSAREPGIAKERSRQFEAITANGPVDDLLLEQFHRSHRPDRGAYSVCMHRAEAATVSMSKLIVSNGEIEFGYEMGAPCESTGVERVKLNLSSPAG